MLKNGFDSDEMRRFYVDVFSSAPLSYYPTDPIYISIKAKSAERENKYSRVPVKLKKVYWCIYSFAVALSLDGNNKIYDGDILKNDFTFRRNKILRQKTCSF